jgi:hypothetical protein
MIRFKAARAGYAFLLAIVGTLGMAVEAVGADVEARSVRHQTSRKPPESNAMPASTQQPNGLGPMRYYGGPKSPMWRG